MSLKKNFLHNILFILSNILFPIISFSYASRIVGPVGIGKVQFVTSFALYFVLISALGIPAYGVREVAKIRGDKPQLSKLISELIVINGISSIILLVIYAVIISSIGWFHHDITFFIIGGIIVLSGFSMLDWFYVGMEQFHFMSIRSIIIKGASVIALILCVKTPDDLIIYFLIIIFSFLGNNLWNLFNLTQQISLKLKGLELRKHLPVLFILFSTSITVSIYTMVDTLFLGFLTDDKTVGFYTAAIKITKMAIPLVASFGTVLIPRITQSIVLKDNASLQKLTDHSFSFICLLGIPISMGLFLYAPEIMTVFSGTKFMEAIPTMQIAAPLIFLIGLGSIFGLQLLIPSGNEKGYFLATILGMAVSVVLYLCLIPLLKDKGAAIATVAGELIVSLTAFYFVHKRMQLSFQWTLGLKAFVGSLVFIPVALLVRNYITDNSIRFIVAIMVCASFYFMIQFFVFKETLMQGVFADLRKRLRHQEPHPE